MILTKTWERYFLKELTKIFCLFLFCFYGIYILVDYANHSHSFHSYRFSFLDIMIFYGYEFILRMEVLIPFAVLIATIKTLCSLNIHNELVALMACGIKLKRILLPFILFGLFFTGLLYINTEFLHPQTMKYRQFIEQSRTTAKQKKHKQLFIQQLAFEDNTSLVFQNYDDASGKFLDAYWIRSIDEFYRIGRLAVDEAIPVGEEVEHFLRNKQGELIVTEFSNKHEFSDMHFNKETLLESVSSPSGKALSALKKKLPSHDAILSEKDAQLLTIFYYKLAIPWVCLLAVIGPAPFCTRFSRTLPVFFIYALSIFGLFSFYLVMDSCALLAERQAISPAVAIWVPFTTMFSFVGWRYLRCR